MPDLPRNAWWCKKDQFLYWRTPSARRTCPDCVFVLITESIYSDVVKGDT